MLPRRKKEIIFPLLMNSSSRFIIKSKELPQKEREREREREREMERKRPKEN
jgi:hypothetical protein